MTIKQSAAQQNTAGPIRVSLRLRDYMDAEDASGVAEGRVVHARLLESVERHLVQVGPAMVVFAISLQGVRRTDASFPRESVMQLAYRFRQQHGFCLWHLDDSDLLENWEAAANRRGQPVVLWHATETGYKEHLLGPRLTEGLRGVFNLLLCVAQKPVEQSNFPEMATADVAAQLGLSISNTSNKLKTLWTEGYIVRREQTAPSGGIEHRYFVAR